MGYVPQDILQCFWKYHSIYHEIESLSRQLSVLHDADIDLTREFTERGHLRSYRPGERIFTQGLPRYFLYVVTLGECQYSRAYPEPQYGLISETPPVTSSPDSMEINLGLVLSPGHFSFMDGCLENEIKFREGEDDRTKRRAVAKEDRRYLAVPPLS